MKWKDKRDVLISTFNDSMEDMTTRQGVIQKTSVYLTTKTWTESRGMMANCIATTRIKNL